MKRFRNDSVKSGKGIDGDLGEDFVKPGPNQFTGYPGGTKGGSEGHGHEPSDERSYAGKYTSNDSGLTQGTDVQFAWEGGSNGDTWGRDIFADVTANQRPRGDDDWGFDAPGPIKAGVNRKQGK